VSVTLEALSVRRGGALTLAPVSLTLDPGLTALIGPNGAGKSTLLQAIAGLTPSTGAARAAGPIAYMPQDGGPPAGLTLVETVMLGRLGALGLRAPRTLVVEAAAMLDRFGLGALGHGTLDEVSGGQRQLVFLAQALFRAPAVLLLDEPTASLDLRWSLIVMQAARDWCAETGGVAVAAMHDLTLAARFADAMVCLCGGRVDAAGAPEAVLTAERLARVYRVEARIARDEDGRIAVTPFAGLGP
jgi:iron complex transport system ATP-binding protein